MSEKIMMPKLGFDMREGVLVRWVKKEGEVINKGDVVAEIETDKATVEVESSASGTVLNLYAQPGDAIPVGTPIALIGDASESIAETDLISGKYDKNDNLDAEKGLSAPLPTEMESENTLPGKRIKVSPVARKIAGEASLNLEKINGTGPGGRIVRRDVTSFLEKKQEANIDSRKQVELATESGTNPSGSDLGSQGNAEQDVKVSMSKLRQAIGRRLVEAKQTIPHFYVTHEFKMDALLDLRKQINGVLPEDGKISVNDFIVKGVALSLREYPNLNSTIKNNEVIQYGSINIGVAVTVAGGLLTIVVKEANNKPIRQISSEIKNMAARVREGKIKPEDVEGSTFSTSNLGMYDVENFIAIINPPEAAILAISSAREIPVVEDGKILVGARMKCALSVDHRISDGAEAARFMQTLAQYLENPLKLIV